MKIAYLAFVRLPTERAHGLQIMKTCEALATEGAEVTLVIPGRKTSFESDPFLHYHIEQKFDLKILGTPDWVGAGVLGFLASITWFAEAAKWTKSFWEAEVIYSRDALVLLQYLLLGRTLVYEAHQAPTALSRFVAQRAYRVVAISPALIEAYAAAGVKREKLILAQDAVDRGMFERVGDRTDARCRLDTRLASGVKMVFYAGSLHPRKGAETLAQAAALLPEVVFMFAGSAERDRMRFWTEAPVRFLGQATHDKVAECLIGADVLVIPNSAQDADAACYASPMKLFEYMASGTPIVATDVPSIKSVLPADAAFYAKPDDPAALAAAITEALSSHDAPERAARARELAKNHSWQGRASTILQSLQTV